MTCVRDSLERKRLSTFFIILISSNNLRSLSGQLNTLILIPPTMEKASQEYEKKFYFKKHLRCDLVYLRLT